MAPPSQYQQSKLYRLLEPGANLHPLEWIVCYGLVAWFATFESSSEWGNAIKELAAWNAKCQFVLFLVMVQIPTLLTGHMSYVDLGWPAGLMVMALNCLTYSKQGGCPLRTKLVAGAMLLHGTRMWMGASYLMFPYLWKDEFWSRYQYAKQRWIQHTGDDSGWWLKQQHDTFMQCNANCVALAIPIILATTNPRTTLHPVEVLGFAGWLVFWSLENYIDVSKLLWETQAKGAGNLKTAVLGYDAPYNRDTYWLWTTCRHPNYFLEWMCWNSFFLMALPSGVLDLETATSKMGVVVVTMMASRLFYDCLVYWTGAAPAESRSVQRRPNYKEFQKTTNVFFPIHVPWVNHHRTPGWPLVVSERKKQ